MIECGEGLRRGSFRIFGTESAGSSFLLRPGGSVRMSGLSTGLLRARLRCLRPSSKRFSRSSCQSRPVAWRSWGYQLSVYCQCRMLGLVESEGTLSRPKDSELWKLYGNSSSCNCCIISYASLAVIEHSGLFTNFDWIL